MQNKNASPNSSTTSGCKFCKLFLIVFFQSGINCPNRPLGEMVVTLVNVGRMFHKIYSNFPFDWLVIGNHFLFYGVMFNGGSFIAKLYLLRKLSKGSPDFVHQYFNVKQEHTPRVDDIRCTINMEN